jgi:hypothetical protein
VTVCPCMSSTVTILARGGCPAVWSAARVNGAATHRTPRIQTQVVESVKCTVTPPLCILPPRDITSAIMPYPMDTGERSLVCQGQVYLVGTQHTPAQAPSCPGRLRPCGVRLPWAESSMHPLLRAGVSACLPPYSLTARSTQHHETCAQQKLCPPLCRAPMRTGKCRKDRRLSKHYIHEGLCRCEVSTWRGRPRVGTRRGGGQPGGWSAYAWACSQTAQGDLWVRSGKGFGSLERLRAGKMGLAGWCSEAPHRLGQA